MRKKGEGGEAYRAYVHVPSPPPFYACVRGKGPYGQPDIQHANPAKTWLVTKDSCLADGYFKGPLLVQMSMSPVLEDHNNYLGSYPFGLTRILYHPVCI